MNTRILRRHLETLGERARMNVEEDELLKTARIRSFSDDDLLELYYRDLDLFATVLVYLSWRRLVGQGRANRDGYVFMSDLTAGSQRLRDHYQELLDSMRIDLDPMKEFPT